MKNFKEKPMKENLFEKIFQTFHSAMTSCGGDYKTNY